MRDLVTQCPKLLFVPANANCKFAPSKLTTGVPRTPLIKKGAEAPQYAHSTGASKTAWRLFSSAHLCLHTEQCMWAGKLYHPPINTLGNKKRLPSTTWLAKRCAAGTAALASPLLTAKQPFSPAATERANSTASQAPHMLGMTRPVPHSASVYY